MVMQSRVEVRWGSFPGTLKFYVQISGFVWFVFFKSENYYFKVEKLDRDCATLICFPFPPSFSFLSGDGTAAVTSPVCRADEGCGC